MPSRMAQFIKTLGPPLKTYVNTSLTADLDPGLGRVAVKFVIVSPAANGNDIDLRVNGAGSTALINFENMQTAHGPYMLEIPGAGIQFTDLYLDVTTAGTMAITIGYYDVDSPTIAPGS
jgi:hypothetical protein